ncbi:MAG: hypothetical protein CMH54_15930 [Myxococcales bacterium]|nr:hypothetical protein [Myxococcales bacterium]
MTTTTQTPPAELVYRAQRSMVRLLDLTTIGCVGASLLVLVLSGEFPPILMLVNGIALFVSIFLGRSNIVSRHRGFFNGLLVVSLAFFGIRAFLNGAYIYEAVLFMATVQVVKLFQRTEPTDILQILSLAMMGLIVGAIANPDLIFALSFLITLLLMTWALLLTHFYRDACRQVADAQSMGIDPDVVMAGLTRRISGPFVLGVTGLSILLFLLTATVFLFFPRMGLGFLFRGGSSASVSAFANKITLGNHGVIHTDNRTIGRVQLPDHVGKRPPLRMYLRGRTQHTYKRGSWSRTGIEQRGLGHVHKKKSRMPFPPKYLESEEPVQARVYLEPISSSLAVLPVPMGTTRISLAQSRDFSPYARHVSVFQDVDGDVYQNSRRRFRLIYDVDFFPKGDAGGKDFDPDDARHRVRYLDVPRNLSKPLSDLALEWGADPTNPLQAAARVEKNLRGRYGYTRNEVVAPNRDPIEYFLFERKKGHCEYFASSMVLMLRSIGIPSRIVSGFAGGEWNRTAGFFTMRNQDAHSWVEVFIAGKGWVHYDPSPRVFIPEATGVFAWFMRQLQALRLRWLVWVVSYNGTRQRQFFRGVNTSFKDAKKSVRNMGPVVKGLLLSGLVLLFFAFVYWRIRTRRERRGENQRTRPPPEFKIIRPLLERLYRDRHLAEPYGTYLRRAAHALGSQSPAIQQQLFAASYLFDTVLHDPKATQLQRRELKRCLRRMRAELRSLEATPSTDVPPPPPLMQDVA